MECGGRLASTVRTAATSAWPITWPPNTRCQPVCGESPRNRLMSSGSRSRRVRRFCTGVDMARARLGQFVASTCYARPNFTRKALEAGMPKALKQHQKTDLVIGGAGFAGLALAIALRQGLGGAFTVTVVDPALAAATS